MRILYTPIGIIHSPFKETRGTPIQPAAAEGIRGTVEVFEEFWPGLNDLDGFSHVILLYHFHRSRGFRLRVVPFLDTRTRGLFATRAPRRPNAIGLSVVRLDRIEKGILHIRNVDVLEGTPLLDVKPYVPDFDTCAGARIGWLEEARKLVRKSKADERFG
jgi:tRNA-Thr(GGU) m(6)t(6)A37 methyltransferase TsaA